MKQIIRRKAERPILTPNRAERQMVFRESAANSQVYANTGQAPRIEP